VASLNSWRSPANAVRRLPVCSGRNSILRAEFGQSLNRGRRMPAHVVHLSEQSLAVLKRADRNSPFVFSLFGTKPFQEFSRAKRVLDQLSGVRGWRLHDLRRTCVSGMARLGVAPHVADKILNHQSGTISGVAAVYQRHDFLAERREALERWGAHVVAAETSGGVNGKIRRVA
jgi:integrase